MLGAPQMKPSTGAGSATDVRADSVTITFETALHFPGDTDPWALVAYRLAFDRTSYHVEVRRRLLRDVYVGNEYMPMLMGITKATSPGGGMRRFRCGDALYELDPQAMSERTNLPGCRSVALEGDLYAVDVDHTDLVQRYGAEDTPGERQFLVQHDGTAKWYYTTVSNEDVLGGRLHRAGEEAYGRWSYRITMPSGTGTEETCE